MNDKIICINIVLIFCFLIGLLYFSQPPKSELNQSTLLIDEILKIASAETIVMNIPSFRFDEDFMKRNNLIGDELNKIDSDLSIDNYKIREEVLSILKNRVAKRLNHKPGMYEIELELRIDDNCFYISLAGPLGPQSGYFSFYLNVDDEKIFENYFFEGNTMWTLFHGYIVDLFDT